MNSGRNLKFSAISIAISLILVSPVSSKTAKAKKNATTTTTATSQLTLMRNILFVRLSKGFYEIREIFMFQNRGKKTIVSKNGLPTLRFLLPSSNNVRRPYAELTAPPQGVKQKNVHLSGAEVTITEPIPPGIKLVGLFYRLADEFGGIMVQRPIVYGTPSFALLPEIGRVQAGVEGLQPRDTVKFGNKEYGSYLGSTRAGAIVRFSLRAPESSGGLVYFYTVGTLFVALGGLLAVWIRIRRRDSLALQVERDKLLHSLASLDDRLELGEISPQTHQRQRLSSFESLREMPR